MLANDIKKGMRIKMTNGWEGTMMDNKKGNIRFAEVEGSYTELGTIYAKDIESVIVRLGSMPVWEPVTLSPAQAKAANAITNAGF